jgi:hypothetical protein
VRDAKKNENTQRSDCHKKEKNGEEESFQQTRKTAKRAGKLLLFAAAAFDIGGNLIHPPLHLIELRRLSFYLRPQPAALALNLSKMPVE